MTVSPEVQKAVDQIRKDKDLIASMREADKVRDKQLSDLQAKLNDHPSLSDEDKAALTGAVDDMRSTNDDLGSAVPANTDPVQSGGPQSGGVVAATPPEYNPDADRPDPLPGTGQNGTVPLMPNSAFDPSPGMGGGAVAGQPSQPKAIETPGGFVIAGGGSVSRAVGSDPSSPSSSMVVPIDPDAKAPANNADLAKSGLGDSSQNALLGNDGRPVADGPGIPGEPSQAAQDAAQKQQDALKAEDDRRRANPLNLAEPGTAIAGSKEADAEALKRRQQEQWDAQQAELAKSNAEQGKPAPGTPGPDPVSAPTGHDGDPNQKPAA